MEDKHYTPWTKRLAALAAGATLLQAGGCAIETEALLNQLAVLAWQVLLDSLFV